METFSRFAILPSEVELNPASKVKKAKQDKPKKENNNKGKEKEKFQQPKNTKQNINQNNKKKKNDEADLQALAFGFGKSKVNKKTGGNNNGAEKDKEKINKNKKGKAPPAKVGAKDVNHNEDWHKRDEEFIKVQNEKSLREAILQSKLEFEQKKEVAVKNDHIEKLTLATKGNKKKKEKPITVSLDEFNNRQMKELLSIRDSNTINANHNAEPKNSPNKLSEEKFFKDVDEATRRTLEKESRQQQYQEYKAKVNTVNKEIQVKKLVSEIEKRDFEIQALRLEVDSLQNQLQAVKSRNKKLCEVISLSEMRSKGELVVELGKVTKDRDEFSEEATRLSAELEKERTKVSHLTSEIQKIQGKKRNADSSTK